MKKSLLCLLVVAFVATPLFAGLGQSEDSVRADKLHMSAAQMNSATFKGYTVYEIRAAGGSTVREYISPTGMVFGVVWEGVTMPDLSQLLGPYFSQFQQAMSEPRRRRGPVYFHAGPLVVESGGHMRAFRGRAYVTSLIPSDLTKDVVR